MAGRGSVPSLDPVFRSPDHRRRGPAGQALRHAGGNRLESREKPANIEGSRRGRASTASRTMPIEGDVMDFFNALSKLTNSEESRAEGNKDERLREAESLTGFDSAHPEYPDGKG